MPSNKSQAGQAESYRDGGIGTSFKPTESPPIAKSMAKIPTPTIQSPSGQEQSDRRGREGARPASGGKNQ